MDEELAGLEDNGEAGAEALAEDIDEGLAQESLEEASAGSEDETSDDNTEDEEGVDDGLPRGGSKFRKQLRGKDSFVAALSSFLKSQGFSLLRDGRRDVSPDSVWDFYKAVRGFEVAVTASAGEDIDLPGICMHRFMFQGRRDKFRRYKVYISTAVNDVFKDNPSLVYMEPPADDGEFTGRMRDVLSGLGFRLGEDDRLRFLDTAWENDDSVDDYDEVDEDFELADPVDEDDGLIG